MGDDRSVSSKIGCTAQTLLDWVKKAEVDGGKRAGVPRDMTEKLKALERNFDGRTRFVLRRQHRSRRSSSPPSNGWTGSTTGSSWSPIGNIPHSFIRSEVRSEYRTSPIAAAWRC